MAEIQLEEHSTVVVADPQSPGVIIFGPMNRPGALTIIALLIAGLAVVLAGKGVSGLQEAGVLDVHPLRGAPRIEILGNPDPDQAHTAVGRGVLFRLLVGEPLRALLTDDDLVLLLGLNAPTLAGAR